MMAKLLGQTVICPDTISSSSGAEGASVSTPNTFATGVRTYTFGRNLGGSWEINAGDGLALAAGTGGVWSGATAGTPDGPYTLSPPTSTSASGSQWGSSGAIYDPPGTTASCTYNPPATLQPQPAYASQLQATPANPAGQITLLSSFWSANPPPNAGPGAFVIVADDYPFAPGGYNSPSYALPPANVVGGAPPFNVGALNGRIFRLGSLVGPSAAGGTIYNLDPAYGMLPNGPYNASPDTVPSPSIPGGPNSYIGQWGIKVYIVGVCQVNNAYVGPTQDTGVFATYFSVN